MEPAAPYATAAVAAEETSSRPDGAPSSRRRIATAATPTAAPTIAPMPSSRTK